MILKFLSGMGSYNLFRGTVRKTACQLLHIPVLFLRLGSAQICTVQHGCHQPYVSSEHLQCASSKDLV